MKDKIVTNNIKFLKTLSKYDQIWNNIKVEDEILYINTQSGVKSYLLSEIDLSNLDNNNFKSRASKISIEHFNLLVDIARYIKEKQEDTPKR